ncbi:MAG: ribosome small subunit-dependent GTPase A [Planctomycetales bacterium]|nr:ribosome small subunit-dependent GTPase A [Planctomycetales bacterium]
MHEHSTLTQIGWKPFFQQQVTAAEKDTAVVSRVSAHYGSQVLLFGEAGELRVPVQLAESAGEIAVGDWLLLNAEDHRTVRRLERQTLLYRKASGEEVRPQLIAANIDTIFIVSSCNEDFNLSRIERYLALTNQAGALPVVVLTKADLCDDPGALRRQAEHLQAGLLVETLNARQPDQTHVLRDWCGPGQTVALLGSSGVGKSTLANALGVGNLATGEIRQKDGRGRHTTTARSLHPLPTGGVLVDNPGIRELQLPACEDGIQEVFDDIVRIAGGCRFRDCRHDGDAGCAVTAAVESGQLDARRYANYLKLNAEQAHNSMTLAERRERDRKIGRFYKSVIKHTRRRREEG